MKNRILELRNRINELNHAYYVENNTLVSDREFDEMLEELIKLESEHPEFYDANSPTIRVGGMAIDKFTKVTHRNPLLSLANTYSKEDVLSFVESMAQSQGKEDIQPEFVVEMKIDGLAMCLIYENGELVLGATRGNGLVGEDVTHNIKTIKTVPLKLNLENIQESVRKTILTKGLDVRGEVYMPLVSFEKANKQREKEGEALFANCRNAAAGTIRQMDPKIAASRGLDAFWYTLNDAKEYGCETHEQSLELLKQLGFKVNPFSKLCKGVEEVWEHVQEISNRRHEVDYDIDGAVIKLNDLQDQENLGYTSKTPRWAKAYKYEVEVTTTVIRDIFITIGRTGRATPNAAVDTVSLANTNVSAATLHNQDYIISKDIRIGDVVEIRKAAEIIPEIVRSLPEHRDASSKAFAFPTHCPSCNEALVRKEGEADTYCVNEQCPSRFVQKLSFFGARDCMNIDNFGESTVVQLVENGLLTSIQDIYKLHEKREELLKLERMGEKSVDNLLNAIEKSKENSLDKVITSLGISEVGVRMGRVLAEHFGTMEALMDADVETLAKIETIALTRANKIRSWFENPVNDQLVKDLKELGLTMPYSKLEITENETFTGKTIVITGSFNDFNRKELTEQLKQLGAKVTSSVSKSTDILVAGEKAGSKMAAAQKHGVRIIEERELLEILK